MLRGIRKASSNWIGKTIMATVMGVLIISFGVWGIADIFRGFGQSTVLKVGSTEITVDQFRQLYNDRLQQIGRQFGRALTQDQARAFGLDRQVLQQTIAEATLDEAARRMGLGQSDADVIRQISADPNFAGMNGKFDPARFAAIIRQYGFTEARYIAEQRKVSLRRQIAATVTSGLEPSQTQLELLTRVRDEQRIVEYVQLGAAQAGTIEDPSPEALASYFDERKTAFRAPEYRKITVVTLSPAEQAKWAEVSDEDATKVFQANLAKYGQPEKRQVLQLVFPNIEEARTARARLESGTSFEDMARERGLGASDYDLGLVTKSGIIDPAIANAVFSLPENQLSEPIEGRFGVVVSKVTKIEPGKEANFGEVATAIKRELATERARTSVQTLHNKMEDERGMGLTVADAAQKTGLAAVTIDAVDRSGRAPDGGPVGGLPQGVDVLSAAFSSDVGVDADPLTLPGGGFVWFDVQGVTPSRERTLDEAREQVVARWREDQISQRLEAKAKEMIEQLKKGDKLADVAKAAEVAAVISPPFKRNAPSPGVSTGVADGAFRLAKGEFDQGRGAQASDRVVYIVADIIEPKFDSASAETKTLKDNVQRSMSDEQIAQYVARLEAQIGSTVNQTAFAQATGAASQNQ